MIILAILLVIISLSKLVSLLTTNTSSIVNVPDEAKKLCYMILAADGMIGLLCGLFILI